MLSQTLRNRESIFLGIPEMPVEDRLGLQNDNLLEYKAFC